MQSTHSSSHIKQYYVMTLFETVFEHRTPEFKKKNSENAFKLDTCKSGKAVKYNSIMSVVTLLGTVFEHVTPKFRKKMKTLFKLDTCKSGEAEEYNSML